MAANTPVPTDAAMVPCGDCGMPCSPDEHHPYAACLMFKACHDSATVRANLNAVRRPACACSKPGLLTPEQIKAMSRRHPAEDLCGWSYRMGIADAEKHYGIGTKKGGGEC